MSLFFCILHFVVWMTINLFFFFFYNQCVRSMSMLMMHIYPCYILDKASCVHLCLGFISVSLLLSQGRVLESGYSPLAYSHARGSERLLWTLEDCLPVHSTTHFFLLFFCFLSQTKYCIVVVSDSFSVLHYFFCLFSCSFMCAFIMSFTIFQFLLY